jgi:glycosyltransferase involved in cell wall biosynthesis
MKVLFQNRPNAFEAWGGDTTQMVATKEALEKQGVEIDVSLDPEPDLRGYDLVHIFNIQTAEHGVLQARNARRSGVPIALSTIYWDRRHMLSSSDFMTYHSSPLVRVLSKIGKPLARFMLSRHRIAQEKLMAEMLQSADVILPNSIAEDEILVDVFRMPFLRAKSVIVPNAVSQENETPESKITEEQLESLPKSYLLEVANFDPGKGQLNLIRGMMDRPEIPIVLIGRESVPKYRAACRVLSEKRGNTFFIDHVPHDQINRFYKRARVHALPSLRESPGLATLEAAMNGANCVVSIHGPIIEYFGSDAWFCDPMKPESIREAVLAAWDAPANTHLRETILQRFTWPKAAQATLDAYNRILAE